MTNQVWLPVDGALLKKLREEAGVDLTTLARIHSLSTAQVKQLEDGGDSSFYTAAIKLATGRKLLMHFGADIAPIEQTVEQNTLPIEESVVDALKVKNDAQNTILVDAKGNNRNSRFLLAGAAVIFFGIAFVYLFVYRSKLETKSEIPVAQTTLTPQSQTNAVEVKSADSSPVSLAESNIKVTKEDSIECKWTNDSIALLGHQPIKSGDYVHLVAKADAVVCVRDSTSKLQILHFKNTQSQTVRGRPPFEIFSHNLHQFQFFYQGNLLRLPSDSIKNITLKEQKYE
jgi:hypothetical protein